MNFKKITFYLSNPSFLYLPPHGAIALGIRAWRVFWQLTKYVRVCTCDQKVGVWMYACADACTAQQKKGNGCAAAAFLLLLLSTAILSPIDLEPCLGPFWREIETTYYPSISISNLKNPTMEPKIDRNRFNGGKITFPAKLFIVEEGGRVCVRGDNSRNWQVSWSQMLMMRFKKAPHWHSLVWTKGTSCHYIISCLESLWWWVSTKKKRLPVFRDEREVKSRVMSLREAWTLHLQQHQGHKVMRWHFFCDPPLKISPQVWNLNGRCEDRTCTSKVFTCLQNLLELPALEVVGEVAPGGVELAQIEGKKNVWSVAWGEISTV